MRVERPARLVLAENREEPDRPGPVAGAAASPARPGPFTTSAHGTTPGPEKSLESLVLAVAQGDRTAFARLFERVAPRVKGYLMTLGAGEESTR